MLERGLYIDHATIYRSSAALLPNWRSVADAISKRKLTRYRASLVEERSRIINRLQKVLEDTNIKLAAVASVLCQDKCPPRQEMGSPTGLVNR
jgi:hypothetical protein